MEGKHHLLIREQWEMGEIHFSESLNHNAPPLMRDDGCLLKMLNHGHCCSHFKLRIYLKLIHERLHENKAQAHSLRICTKSRLHGLINISDATPFIFHNNLEAITSDVEIQVYDVTRVILIAMDNGVGNSFGNCDLKFF